MRRSRQLSGSRWGALSLASADASEREARRSPKRSARCTSRGGFRFASRRPSRASRDATAPGDNNRDAARRSLEALRALAEPLGVRLALEVMPNELSRAGSLVHFLEDDLDSP